MNAIAENTISRPNSDEARLAEQEKIIARALRNYIDKGKALREIRGDGPYKTRLYRAAEHETFEAYCQDRWELAKRSANQLIAAAEVAEILGAMAPEIPACERHARPLTALRSDDDSLDADAIQECWADVLQACDGACIKAVDVTAAIERYHARKPAPPGFTGNIPIASIKIGERHREDMGNIDALAGSIVAVGLLQPIAVTPDKELISGQRRIEAYKRLGLAEIPARVIEVDCILDAYLSSKIREDYTDEERMELYKTLKKEPRAAKRRVRL